MKSCPRSGELDRSTRSYLHYPHLFSYGGSGVTIDRYIKMVPYVKENKLILDISLDMCIFLLSIATVDHLQCFHHICCLPSNDALTQFHH